MCRSDGLKGRGENNPEEGDAQAVPSWWDRVRTWGELTYTATQGRYHQRNEGDARDQVMAAVGFDGGVGALCVKFSRWGQLWMAWAVMVIPGDRHSVQEALAVLQAEVSENLD